MLWNSNSNNNLFVDAFSYSINSISNKQKTKKEAPAAETARLWQNFTFYK